MPVTLPQDYWGTYQRTVPDLTTFLDDAAALVATWPNKTFVWRGVARADLGLHSSLYWKSARAYAIGDLKEPALSQREAEVVNEARRWGLQRTATDSLSAIELIAALQHQGVPTRFVDFTHNALVALWFAVEERFDAAGARLADEDGRVFIAESTDRETPDEWNRDPDLPWDTHQPADWTSNILVWTPPPIDPRIIRQQGCFVVGGVPSTAGGWNIKDSGAWRAMRAHEIRRCVSIPIRLKNPAYIRATTLRGHPVVYPLAFTLLIPGSSKEDLRRGLYSALGFDHARLYPDYPGFASFGRAIPRVQ